MKLLSFREGEVWKLGIVTPRGVVATSSLRYSLGSSVREVISTAADEARRRAALDEALSAPAVVPETGLTLGT